MSSLHDSYLYTVDEETAAIIIQIQLEDAECLFSKSKGKYREDDMSDEELALQLYKQELDESATIISDRRMTQSIARAVQLDGPVLQESLSAEHCVAKDREMARRLTNDSDLCTLTLPDIKLEESMDDEFIAKLQALYVSKIESSQQLLQDPSIVADNGAAESSSWASTRPANLQSINRRCEACHEDKKFFDVARVPFHHEYCRDCLKDLFQTSLTDESLFPPRCCRQSIPIGSVRLFLSSELVYSYEQKNIEFETPNRTYFCSQTCSVFIRVENVRGEIATCPDCGTKTCTSCKMAAHTGDCPNDVALQQVLQAALENGWQRCHSCWRIVELEHGCNHMTCRCGAQFCYVCGQIWKQCNCEQWDEHRLLARANQILDRDHEPVPALQNEPLAIADLPQIVEEHQPEDLSKSLLENIPLPAVLPTRDILVAQTMRNLLANHECIHKRWRWVQGPHTYEECHYYLRQYIFECLQCQLQACNRCRRNRL